MIEFIQTFVFLFAVIDPLGSVPVFLEATKSYDSKIKKEKAIKAILYAAFIFVFFIVKGQIIMETMNISLSVFQIQKTICNIREAKRLSKIKLSASLLLCVEKKYYI